MVSGRTQGSTKTSQLDPPTWPAEFPGEEEEALRRRRRRRGNPFSDDLLTLSPLRSASRVGAFRGVFWPGEAGGWGATAGDAPCRGEWNWSWSMLLLLLLLFSCGDCVVDLFVLGQIFFFLIYVGGWLGLVSACSIFLLDWCCRVSCLAQLIVALGENWGRGDWEVCRKVLFFFW